MNEYDYRIEQLKIMLNEVETDCYSYARLKTNDSKAITLDNETLKELIKYYELRKKLENMED